MASAIDMDMAHDWAKRCGDMARGLVNRIAYIGDGAAPDQWVEKSGNDVEDAADFIIRQLKRWRDVSAFADRYVTACNDELIRVYANNVRGYRAAGRPYHHAHGALVGVAGSLCTVIEAWDDRTTVTAHGHVEPLNEPRLRENLVECCEAIVNEKTWISSAKIEGLIHRAEWENVQAKANLTAAPPPAPNEDEYSRLTTKSEIARVHAGGAVANPTDYWANLVASGKAHQLIGRGKQWRAHKADFTPAQWEKLK